MKKANKKCINKYDRVMSRVYDPPRSNLTSSSVTRHRILSSARIGAKPLANFSSSVFNDLPTVLNDYEPDQPAERTFVVKPRRTVKSLDPAKSPQQGIVKTPKIVSKPFHLRTQGSAPSVFHRDIDKWSDVHLRECYSSRSHSKLIELKPDTTIIKYGCVLFLVRALFAGWHSAPWACEVDFDSKEHGELLTPSFCRGCGISRNEIQAYHETEKYMKLRSRLYKSCGVVLDDVGQVKMDKGVQAESDPDLVSFEKSSPLSSEPKPASPARSTPCQLTNEALVRDGVHEQRRPQQPSQQRWRVHACSFTDGEHVQRRPQQTMQRRPWQRRREHAFTNSSGWVPAGASSHELTGSGSTQSSVDQIACKFDFRKITPDSIN